MDRLAVGSSPMCRVCLASNADIPIFEHENKNSVYSRLILCVGEEIPDIDGYPRNICEDCDKELTETVAFIKKYKYSQQLFHNHIEIDNVKVEEVDIDSTLQVPKTEPSYFDSEYSTQEVEIENDADETSIDFIQCIKDKVKRSPANTNPKPVEDLIKLLKKNKVISVKKTNTKIGKQKSLKKLQKKKKGQKKNSNAKIAKVEEAKTNKKFKKKKPEDGNDLSERSSPESTEDLENDLENNNDDALDDFQWPLSKLAEIDSKTVYTKSSDIQKKIATEATSDSKLCELCGQNFTDNNSYYKHKRYQHNDQVKCPVCSKSMGSNGLKRHMRRVHGEKNHICPNCGKTFYSPGFLAQHIRVVHLKINTVKARVECKICRKTYASKKPLLIHTRSVHTGERPEVCSVCDARFYHEDYLKEHMRLHTGETPFKCPVCARGYAQSANMKSHITHNHKLSDLDEITRKLVHPRYLRLMKP